MSINNAINKNAIVSVKVQVFTTAGTFTYTASTGMLYATIEMVGGGGGSGASLPTGPSEVACGSAGGGGAYVRSTLSAATIASPVSIVVGAGGAGSTTISAGSNGGNSTFGSLLTAGGGVGGNSCTPQPYGTKLLIPGGVGGTATGGNLNLRGGNGGECVILGTGGSFVGFVYSAVPGGCTYFSPAFLTDGYGTGGHGLPVGENFPFPFSQFGVSGIIVITEFCNQ